MIYLLNRQIPKAVEFSYIAISDIHMYATINNDILCFGYENHEFMYIRFQFVGMHIWNHICVAVWQKRP